MNETELRDPLAPARGILIGVVVGAIAWLLVIAAVIHRSVFADLAHKAIDAGVFG